jgi:hypothetical protein
MSTIAKNIEIALTSYGNILEEFNFPKVLAEEEFLIKALNGLFRKIKHCQDYHSDSGEIISKYKIKLSKVNSDTQRTLNRWFDSVQSMYRCVGAWDEGDFTYILISD